jgi:hypothetical protein
MIKFNKEETTILFEAARIALSDGEIFDNIAEEMDVSDEVLVPLRDKLEKYMMGQAL